MDLKEYQDEMAKKRRINNLVLAILNRAKEAGIPEDFMRINKNEFKELLCPEFAESIGKTPDSIANMIFDDTENFLSKYQFVLVDGGTKYERKRASFAMMFKFIACGRYGKYELGDTLIHTIEDFAGSASLSRNEYTDTMALYDTLFVSEFDPNRLNAKRECGSFLDEIFENREDNKRVSIISFNKTICETTRVKEAIHGNFTVLFTNPNNVSVKNILRIRVKV